MLAVFKSLELQNVLIRNIDVYGCLVLLSRRLSQEFVRKSLAECFIFVKNYGDGVSHWLGYLLHRDNDLPAICSHGDQHWYQHGK